MLPAELISQIKRLELRAGHLVTDALAGEYLSAFRGQGMEFDEVRGYVPGDDIRAIDWNVTARMNFPYVKIHKEEREQTLMLMVDVSPSQLFGTVRRAKNEVSTELAAVLAFLATRNNDKVGLLAFSDNVEKYIPPKKGRAHIWRIIREILTYRGSGQTTNIGKALEYMLQVVKRRSSCFLISDFCAQNYERQLLHASRRHNMICARIYDPRELILPDVGFIDFEDSESHERLVVNTSSRRFRQTHEAMMREKSERYLKFLKSHQIDSMSISSAESVVKPLEEFLRFKERRQR